MVAVFNTFGYGLYWTNFINQIVFIFQKEEAKVAAYPKSLLKREQARQYHEDP